MQRRQRFTRNDTLQVRFARSTSYRGAGTIGKKPLPCRTSPGASFSGNANPRRATSTSPLPQSLRPSTYPPD